MEKFLEYLYEADKKIQTVDHMANVTFPLIKDKRLLIKILTEINLAMLSCINAILQYEYIYNRIPLTKDAATNLNIFKKRCAPSYNIGQDEITTIVNIIELNEKHKKSPFEFIKEGKVVILSENLRAETITIERLKSFIITIKTILKKTKSKIVENYHY